MKSEIKKPLRIVAIGDSITAGFHADSNISMLWQMWFGKKKSWFSEVVKRIGKEMPVYAFNFSTASSELVDHAFSGFWEKLFNVKTMADQVDELLSLPKLPDLVLIWIGHNDLDWVRKNEKNFDSATARFKENFQNQLERLCGQISQKDHRAVVVVFGFINIRIFFDLREKAGIAKQNNPKLFPYFEKGYQIFKSIQPEYGEQTIQLSDLTNQAIVDATTFLQNKFQSNKFKIIYSTDLSNVTTDSIQSLHAVDGWHPSLYGQKQLAEACWPIIWDCLSFFKID